jgi:small subunit ribosomal protein S6
MRRLREMHSYESIIIFRPDLAAEEIDKLLAKFEKMITSSNGEMIHLDKWGLKKTAFQVKKYRDGFFVYLNFKVVPEMVNNLKKTYLVTDGIIRSITTKVRKPRRIKPKKEKVKVAPAASAEPKVEG